MNKIAVNLQKYSKTESEKRDSKKILGEFWEQNCPTLFHQIRPKNSAGPGLVISQH